MALNNKERNAKLVEELQKRSEQFSNRKDFSERKKHQWHPPEGKSRIRILPYRHAEEDFPFIRVKQHWRIGKYMQITCPETFGEPCALCDLSEKYRKASWKKDEISGKGVRIRTDLPYYETAGKVRYFSPIIVRGAEAEGVKFFDYSEKLFQSLTEIFKDIPENGYVIDELEGSDVNIQRLKPATGGEKRFDDIIAQVVRKSSPILPNTSEIEDLLKSVPNLFGTVLDIHSSEYVQKIVDELMDDSEIINLDYRNSNTPIVKGNGFAQKPTALNQESQEELQEEMESVPVSENTSDHDAFMSKIKNAMGNK